MHSIEKKTIILALSIALAFAHAYAGLGTLTNPSQWQIFVPAWITSLISVSSVLYLHAFLDIAIALLILYPKTRFYGAILSALNFTFIILSNLDQLFIVFRDVPLLMGAVLVAFLVYESRAASQSALHSQ
ncbi:hypothetical protein KW805_04845 [Candidatus Pacearchaeota archaeon]|nr:hypothetical protein [Candidatus Pacearchaeota archaeon]